jgi:hypothetical protein
MQPFLILPDAAVVVGAAAVMMMMMTHAFPPAFDWRVIGLRARPAAA